jgi:hypothetical protein
MLCTCNPPPGQIQQNRVRNISVCTRPTSLHISETLLCNEEQAVSPLRRSKHVVYLSHIVILAKRFDTNMTTIQPNPPSEHDMRHLLFTLVSLSHPSLNILGNLIR